MVDAHLDSVPAGPGIVDDGSGVASLLEIATRLGSRPQVKNAVRFGLFGNEETGSQGSTSYVQSLSAADRRKVTLYLNVDMVASPNAGYFAQGGKGDKVESAGPAGSATVGRELADELASTGVQPEAIEFVGDDESPFIDAGIPVGGAENGDRKRKTSTRLGFGVARRANATTRATTRHATASTTSTMTCSTTTFERSLEPSRTSRHQPTTCSADPADVEPSDSWHGSCCSGFSPHRQEQ
jgi:Zn-dependent M28 family amino/carboxypeptidase